MIFGLRAFDALPDQFELLHAFIGSPSARVRSSQRHLQGDERRKDKYGDSDKGDGKEYVMHDA